MGRTSHLASFNFLNGTKIRIVLNKRGGIGMGATRPKPVPLSFLYLPMIHKNQILKFIFIMRLWI